jgi:Transglutaminase-like superfamily
MILSRHVSIMKQIQITDIYSHDVSSDLNESTWKYLVRSFGHSGAQRNTSTQDAKDRTSDGALDMPVREEDTIKKLSFTLFILWTLMACSRGSNGIVPDDSPVPPSAVVNTGGVIPPVEVDTSGPVPPPVVEPLTTEEEAMAIVIDMESYELAPATISNRRDRVVIAQETIQQRRGVCGERAYAMLYLLEQKSIPCRYVGIFGLSAFGVDCYASHATVEVFYDGAWHWYDPTYGVWFTKNGVVMSFAQLCSNAYDGNLINRGRGDLDDLRDLIGFFQNHGAVTYGYDELAWMGRFLSR